MDAIEQIKNSDPAYAEGFIKTAIRFYSEALVTGDPGRYFSELSNLNYPDVDTDRKAELNLAKLFISWHNQQVTQVMGEESGLPLYDGMTEDELEARNEELKEELMQIALSTNY